MPMNRRASILSQKPRAAQILGGTIPDPIVPPLAMKPSFADLSRNAQLGRSGVGLQGTTKMSDLAKDVGIGAMITPTKTIKVLKSAGIPKAAIDKGLDFAKGRNSMTFFDEAQLSGVNISLSDSQFKKLRLLFGAQSERLFAMPKTAAAFIDLLDQKFKRLIRQGKIKSAAETKIRRDKMLVAEVLRERLIAQIRMQEESAIKNMMQDLAHPPSKGVSLLPKTAAASDKAIKARLANKVTGIVGGGRPSRGASILANPANVP